MAQITAADGTKQEVKFDKQDKVDLAEHAAEILWRKGRVFFYVIGLLAIVVTWFGVTYFTLKAKTEMQAELNVFVKEVTDAREKIKALVAQADADVKEARRRLYLATSDLQMKTKEIQDVSVKAKEQIDVFQKRMPPPKK